MSEKLKESEPQIETKPEINSSENPAVQASEKNPDENSNAIQKKESNKSELIPQDPAPKKEIKRPASSRIVTKTKIVQAFQKKTGKSKSPDNLSIPHAFQISLSKLAQNETRERGIKEIKELISNNASHSNLRTFFSILSAAKTDIFSEKEAYLLILSHICSVYKDKLLDPIEKTPDLKKTVLKEIEYIHGFFSDNRGVIQKLCAKSLIDVYENRTKSFDQETQIVMILVPLVRLINLKSDQNVLGCACFCLLEMLKVVASKQDEAPEIMAFFFKEISSLFKKKPEASCHLIKAFTMILSIQGKASLSEGKTQEYLEKLLAVLSNQNKTASIQMKIECCSCIEKIASILTNMPEEIKCLGGFLNSIIETLYENSKEKDLSLRNASNQALNEWLKIIGKFKEELKEYTNLYKPANPVPPKGNSAWKDLKNIRNLVKISKQEKSKALNNGEQSNNLQNEQKSAIKKPQKELINERKPFQEENLKDPFRKTPLENKVLNVLPKQKTSPDEIQPLKDRLEPLKNVKSVLKRQKTSPIQSNLERNNQENNPKTVDNATQIKAANFQRKKTGMGGGQIPNNTQMETKLGLLKEMIRKSIEKRPMSVDSLKQRPIKRQESFPKEPLIIENKPKEEVSKESKAKNANRFNDKKIQDDKEAKIIQRQASFAENRDDYDRYSSEKNESDGRERRNLHANDYKMEDARRMEAETQKSNQQQDHRVHQNYQGKHLNIDEYDENLRELIYEPKSKNERNFSNQTPFEKVYSRPKEGLPEKKIDPYFNDSVITIDSQKIDTKELFFFPSPNNRQAPQKNAYVRPPQSFEAPLFEQITAKLDSALKNSKKNLINKPQKTIAEKERVEPWDQALFCLGCGDYEGAYNQLLNYNDDIYLMRLMIKTGPCFDQIQEKTGIKVINRMLELANVEFIERTCFKFFLEAKEANLLDCLSLNDQKYFCSEI